MDDREREMRLAVEAYVRWVEGVVACGGGAVKWEELEVCLARLAGAVVGCRAWQIAEEPEGVVPEYDDVVAGLDRAVGADLSALAREEREVEDLVRLSLFCDDLTDIYRDLKRPADQWRRTYGWHWGAHLHRAMATVHEVRYRLGRA